MTVLFKSWLPLLACLGGLLAGYDTGIIGSALLFIQSQFHLSTFLQGMFASSIIPGIMSGIMIASFLTDRYDHRLLIRAASIVYLVGILITATSIMILFLFLGRIITGIAIGIILVVVPLYLSEISLAKFRGRFIATFQLAITFGIFSGYFISYWLSHDASWRLMFLCGLAGAFLLLGSSFYLPLVLRKIKKTSDEDISWFRREYKRPFLIGIGLAILQQVTGINAILYFAPQILVSVHHQADTNAIFSALIIAGGNFLFTIVSLFLLDSVGRRPVLILSLVFQCLALAIFALASTFTFESQTFLFVCCLLLYFFGFAIGLGPVTWLIISEIYPSAIRGKAIGITVMINNIMAFTVAGFFLSVLHKVGAANTFWIFSIIAFSGLLFVLWFIPETRQKSLDEIEMQFRKKN